MEFSLPEPEDGVWMQQKRPTWLFMMLVVLLHAQTNRGFSPGPDYGKMLWRMHPDPGEDGIIRHREAFADMFLSWVYGELGLPMME